MSLFKMVSGSEGKSQVEYSTPAAGAVTVGDDEMALWVGNTIAGQPNVQQSVFSVVNDLLERLREVGTPTASATGRVTSANASCVTSIPAKVDVLVQKDVAFAVPAETDIRLYIGDLFQPLPGTSVSTAVKRLLETWMERVAKKAA